MEHIQKYYFCKSQKMETRNSEIGEQNWKRMGPESDEDLSKNLGNLEYGINLFQKACNEHAVILFPSQRRHVKVGVLTCSV